MYKSHNSKPIDIVIPWVDDNDPNWQKCMLQFASNEGRQIQADFSEERFRDWNILQYLFRGISLYVPWVRKVHLVTWGHIPEWLNTSSDRISIVRHEDFIPKDYLPTFSSHCIELNLHRIEQLAENFIYFNDDMLILRQLDEKDFFKRDIPCDYAILNAFTSSHRYSVMDTALTDIEIINDHFKKNEMIKHNIWKWVNIKYGKKLFRTALMMPWKRISSFYGQHACVAYSKKTFREVWEQEFEVLDATCRHHFRTRRDVNQWLVRHWRLAKGDFVPRSPKGFGYYVLDNDNSQIINAIQSKNNKVICVNDVIGNDIVDFRSKKKDLLNVLNTIYPEKSEFEV